MLKNAFATVLKLAPVLALMLGTNLPAWAAEADTGLPAELLGEPPSTTPGTKPETDTKSATAQSTTSQSTPPQSTTDDGNQIVTRSMFGAWVLRTDAAKPGLNCAIRFIPGRGTAQFAIFGPTEKTAARPSCLPARMCPGQRQKKTCRPSCVCRVCRQRH